MRGFGGQVFAIVLFVALLATTFVLNRASSPDNSSRYGFRLVEVSQASGIEFRHEAPRLDPKLDAIMPQIASMGASVAVADFDRDGWPDLYVTTSSENGRNRLYHNLKDGKFADVADAMGVADYNKPGTGASMGSIWGDYDNDGYEDLFLYKWGKPELFHNNAGKSFSQVTATSGLPEWINSGCATWVDFDRDGLLDLFVGGYWNEKIDLWHLQTTKIMPESFEYATNGGRKHLLRNRGQGRFEDVTEAAGLNSHRWALCVAAADLLGTGYPDLFVANDYGVSELYANQEGKRFVDVGKKSGVGASPKSGMNVAFGDIYNQGRFAIYVSNISEPGVLIQGNNLWVPRSFSSGDSLQYDNLAHELGVELGGWSFGAQFGDLDNDGNQDLILTNGYISAAKGTSYWYEYSKISGGNTKIISDTKNWPAMGDKSLSGYQQKKLWLNAGAGHFSEIAQAVGFTDVNDGRAVALVDLWNRGVLDVVEANQKGPLLIYKNMPDANHHWVGFELRGKASNRSAIGAQVRLFWDDLEQLQEVSGGCGYSSQNQRGLHFGVGKSTKVAKAVIRWPSGQTQTIDAPRIDQVHQIEEP